MSDQYIAEYKVMNKINRWWVTLFLHVIDLAVVNFISFGEWQAMHPRNEHLKRKARFGQLKFREELTELGLTEKHRKTQRNSKNYQNPNPCTFLQNVIPTASSEV